MANNYSGNESIGEKFDTNLSTKEIAVIIRKELKKTKCKFSVTSNHNRINVYLMAAPFEVFAKEVDSKNLQINYYYVQDDERITDEAKKILKKVASLLFSYNRDDSDAMVDYFDTNFYMHVEIGKWDKPFIKKVA